MTHQIEWHNGLVGILVATLIVNLWSAGTMEAVTVDGVLTPGDGYSTTIDLSFEVEGVTEVQTGAKLHMHQAAGSLFFGLALPKTLVDNSYGTTAIGWGASAPSGKDHKFQELVGSDKAQFIFRDANDADAVVMDLTLDYLSADGKDVPPPYVADKTAKDFKVVPGTSIDDILNLSTSLKHNWDIFGLSDPGFFGKDVASPAADPDYGNPEVSGWVYDVMYEFEIDAGALAGVNLYGGDFIEIIHASPNKIGGNKVRYFEPGPAGTPPIPEPLTLLGVLIGVTGLRGYLRRRVAA